MKKGKNECLFKKKPNETFESKNLRRKKFKKKKPKAFYKKSLFPSITQDGSSDNDS